MAPVQLVDDVFLIVPFQCHLINKPDDFCFWPVNNKVMLFI